MKKKTLTFFMLGIILLTCLISINTSGTKIEKTNGKGSIFAQICVDKQASYYAWAKANPQNNPFEIFELDCIGEGQYSKDKIPVGNYKVKAGILGYKTQTQYCAVKEGQQTTLNFNLVKSREYTFQNLLIFKFFDKISFNNYKNFIV